MVKNGRFSNTNLHHRRGNMNYKLDKEYIVKRFRPLLLAYFILSSIILPIAY